LKVTFKLDTFEGPLDLLLHLIDQAEVDIYNIPIKEITDQYLEYLSQMQEMELDVTSEFLVMAATLLSIKSKMLLPKPPVIEMDDMMFEMEEEDPRSELVQKLIEYRKYKGIAEELREKEIERSLIFSREPADLSPYVPVVQENPVQGLHVADLLLAFQKALRKMASRNVVTKIRRDEVSVKDRMFQVVSVLEQQGGKMMFTRLLSDDFTREDVVVTFLALLELMKVKKIVCFQHRLFDDIVIEAREEVLLDGLPEDEINY